jgi:mycothiol maleylpyruvate isomerase-like protein
MSELDLATVTAKDGHDLLTAAGTDWSRPIPHCPGWDAADLVGHMGGILAWMARIVTTGAPVPRRDRETPPSGHASLASWYSAHLDRTVDILTTTPADSPAWTFSSRGERRAGWWRRRQPLGVSFAAEQPGSRRLPHHPDLLPRSTCKAGCPGTSGTVKY